MEVWATGRTEEKRALATTLGALRTFAPGEQLLVKVLTVFDFSGAQTFQHSMEIVETGGTVLCCGVHSGSRFAQVDPMKLSTANVEIVGSYAGNKDDFEGLARIVSEKDLEPYMGAVLPIERVEEGLKLSINGIVFGKVVIRMQV